MDRWYSSITTYQDIESFADWLTSASKSNGPYPANVSVYGAAYHLLKPKIKIAKKKLDLGGGYFFISIFNIVASPLKAISGAINSYMNEDDIDKHAELITKIYVNISNDTGSSMEIGVWHGHDDAMGQWIEGPDVY